MRRGRVGLALGLLLALAACGHTPEWEREPPAPTEAAVVQPGTLHRSELDNGLAVMVLEDHRLPRVVLAVTTRRGESSASPERAGLGAFTSELMERGAGERSALALAQAVDEIGASLQVGNDWDSVTVQISGLSRDLDRLLEILADVVLRPRFDPAEAVKARAETLAGLEKAKDAPATLLGWYTSRAVFGDHRYSFPLSGTPETVATLVAADARDFHERVFLPNNAIFSASGDVDHEDLLARAGAAFGSWQPGEIPGPGVAPPAHTPPARVVWIVDRPDLVQTQIALAHEGIARTDPDRIAAAIMNSVLGGSVFSSRLMNTVRSEAGLTYSVQSGFSLRRWPSIFTVATFTRVAETRTVIDLLLHELERMRSDPPTREELAAAKTLATGSFALGLETSDAVMASLVDLAVYGLPEDSLDTYRSRVREVDVEKVAELTTRLLHPQRTAIVLVGPAAELAPQVEGLGPVEILKP